MRPTFALAAPLAVVSLLAACGGAPVAPEPIEVPAPGAETARPAEAAAAPATTDAATAPAPAPAGPPVLASDSFPPGVSPLTEAEAAELAGKCKPFTDAVTSAAKKAGRSQGSTDIARDVLKKPPQVPGVDVPRCASLMGRELTAYRARTLESEAVIGLKRMAFGMAEGFRKENRHCPSTVAVPDDPEGMGRAGGFASTPEDWSSEGWQCLGFSILGEQHWSFRLTTDEKGRWYEGSAIGYPVEGGPGTELYIRVELTGPADQPPESAPIYRRTPRIP